MDREIAYPDLPKRQRQMYDAIAQAGEPVKPSVAAILAWTEDPTFPPGYGADCSRLMVKKGVLREIGLGTRDYKVTIA